MALSPAQKASIKKMQAGARKARSRKRNPGRRRNGAVKAKLAGVPIVPAIVDFAGLAGGAFLSSVVKPTVDMQVMSRIPGGLKVRGIANLLVGVLAIAVGKKISSAVKQLPGTISWGMAVPFMRDGFVDLGIGRTVSGLGYSSPAAPIATDPMEGTFGGVSPMGALYDPMNGTIAVSGYEPMGRPNARRIL